MKQITEDYVSYETAKLLKEKKFSWKCNTAYLEFEDGRVELRYEDKAFYQEQTKRRYCVPALLAPSLYNTMKWLREVHNIHIEIYRTACGYLYIISNIPYGTDLYNPEYGGDDENSGQWTTYEKAVEAAIKYTLENLI